MRSLSPLEVLSRGYAVVTGVDGRPLLDAAEVEPGDGIVAILRRGRLRATVESNDDS
jgi:exodeoxyribonuclease VII large subunit